MIHILGYGIGLYALKRIFTSQCSSSSQGLPGPPGLPDPSAPQDRQDQQGRLGHLDCKDRQDHKNLQVILVKKFYKMILENLNNLTKRKNNYSVLKDIISARSKRSGQRVASVVKKE